MRTDSYDPIAEERRDIVWHGSGSDVCIRFQDQAKPGDVCEIGKNNGSSCTILRGQHVMDG